LLLTRANRQRIDVTDVIGSCVRRMTHAVIDIAAAYITD